MSDSEDDYMSEKFLQNDSKPGLMPKIFKVKHERIEQSKRKDTQKNKPMKVQEAEKREEKLKEALDESNKGFAMLSKMGFKKGMGLGKKGQGRAEPIPLQIREGRKGLGRQLEEDQKKKRFFEAQMVKAKRLKLEEDHLRGDFKCRMRDKVIERQINSDLYKSQKACQHLDTLKNLDPQHPWSWPKVEMEDESDDENDDEAEIFDEPQPPEKLEILTYYLRATHLYCIWCGATFNDQEDLKENCPGDTFDAHE